MLIFRPFQAESKTHWLTRVSQIVMITIFSVVIVACIPQGTESPNETDGVVYEFPEVGVTVTVPPQNNFSDVVLERLPLEGVPEMESDEEYFKLGRLVINFILYESENPEVILEEFDPPIEVQVKFTPADVEFADVGEKELAFAFWDGNEWIRFTEEKHQFNLNPLEEDLIYSGFAQVFIQNWSDPSVAIGR
jgi:hypothetical protein